MADMARGVSAFFVLHQDSWYEESNLEYLYE